MIIAAGAGPPKIGSPAVLFIALILLKIFLVLLFCRQYHALKKISAFVNKVRK
jgi:hypothetical protein